MNWFKPKPCEVCPLKDAIIERLRDDLARERLRLDRAEHKAETATDALLAEAGKPVLQQPQRFTAKDSDNVMADTFAIFRDEDDKGDGKIRDMDNLDFDR
jgi:hypothetical protein